MTIFGRASFGVDRVVGDALLLKISEVCILVPVQRSHSGQGFSPKVQQQLGFSPVPSEHAGHEPIMTFGQAGQGGPTGRAHELVPSEHRDAARELEAQQAFMRQKALQRHQEAMAHQQQQQQQVSWWKCSFLGRIFSSTVFRCLFGSLGIAIVDTGLSFGSFTQAI